MYMRCVASHVGGPEKIGAPLPMLMLMLMLPLLLAPVLAPSLPLHLPRWWCQEVQVLASLYLFG